jgi:predicted dehydrogenase
MFKGASGGGAMMDVGIHMTDLARYVMGEVREVYGVASNRIWQVEGSEDNALAILKSDKGIPAFYQATWTEWKGYRFFIEAYGDRGMARAYYAPMFNLLVTQDRPGGPRRRHRKFYPEIMLREKLKGWQSTVVLTFMEEFADFVRAASGQDGDLVIGTGTDGWRAAAIAEAVRHKGAGTFAELPAPPDRVTMQDWEGGSKTS